MNINEVIKKAGLKVTPQRIIVYELMTEMGHSPVDEIISRVQRQNPGITISTVYRILDSFVETKLLSKVIHPTNEKYYFDLNPSPHHHLYVNNKATDFVDEELDELIKRHLNEKELFKGLDFQKISIEIIAVRKNE